MSRAAFERWWREHCETVWSRRSLRKKLEAKSLAWSAWSAASILTQESKGK